MLITFKSGATADILMLGPVGQQMLEIVGKDPQEARGIITLSQLPAAIEALSAALADSRAASRQAPSNEDEDDAPRGMAAPVSLAQRIAPLLDALRQALREEQPVIWEAH